MKESIWYLQEIKYYRNNDECIDYNNNKKIIVYIFSVPSTNIETYMIGSLLLIIGIHKLTSTKSMFFFFFGQY